ncbi:MAG: molybdopterin-dependent oxidoreductase [Chloroflexi bacterium]|nr:molybdopterin-dependent oxidoreductase [Chloroflexota bacterium]
MNSGAAVERKIRTLCGMCYNACGIVCTVRDGKIVNIEGDNQPGISNMGRICSKAPTAMLKVGDPHRLTSPMKRTNPQKGLGVDPGWAKISWDEAFDIITSKLKEVREDNPARLLHSEMNTHTSLYAIFDAAFGTESSYMAGPGYPGVWCGGASHVISSLYHWSLNDHVDIQHCNYLIAWGTGIGTESFQSLTWYAREIANARVERGMKLVVVNPRLSNLAAKADEWVPIRPGTDGALVHGMLHVLLHELNTYDRRFLQKYTNAPYLIGPDGNYVRDKESGKPLIWDSKEPKPYDDPSIRDEALEGEYEANGVECSPAFQLFKDIEKEYTPEWAAKITTIPAATIRRLTKEYAEAARIGSTITLEGKEWDYRPVGNVPYSGFNNSAHSSLDMMALSLLSVVVGAFDCVGSTMCFDFRSGVGGKHRPLPAGPDGLFAFGTMHRFVNLKYPLERRDGKEYAPIAFSPGPSQYYLYSDPKRYGLTFGPEEVVALMDMANPLMTSANPKIVGDVFSKLGFAVHITVRIDETSQFADVLIPDATMYEKVGWGMIFPERHEFSGDIIYQPVVDPPPGVMANNEFYIELAERLGILRGKGGLNFFFNLMYQLQGTEYELDLDKRYSNEEMADRYLRRHQGHDLAWFRENLTNHQRVRADERYRPSLYNEHRVPFYLHYLKKTGEDLGKFFEGNNIPADPEWQEYTLADYLPLPVWKPSKSYPFDPEYDLFAISFKTIYLYQSDTAHNPIALEAAEIDPYILPIWINPDTALRKGIKEGDTIWVESKVGKVSGKAKLTAGVHPEVLAITSIVGQWGPNPVPKGKGPHFNRLLDVTYEHVDAVSGTPEHLARVKVYK